MDAFCRYVFFLVAALATIVSFHSTPAVAETTPRPVAAPLLGGSPVELQNSPVALVLNVEFLCTGLLVGPRTILTAGHCVSGSPSDYRVVVGEKKYRVSAIAQKDGFNDLAAPTLATIKHDLGVLILESPVEEIAPVPLLSNLPVQRGTRLFVVARGANEIPDAEQPLGEGRRADFEVEDVNGSVLISSRSSFNTATCAGDSGAPVFQSLAGITTVVGVVSAGNTQMQSDGRCTPRGNNLSVFVDLQSSSSQPFLAGLSEISYVDGGDLVYRAVIDDLSRTLSLQTVRRQGLRVIKTLLALRKIVNAEKAALLTKVIRSLRAAHSASSPRVAQQYLVRVQSLISQAKALSTR